MKTKAWIAVWMIAVLSLAVAACNPTPTPVPPTATPTHTPTHTPTPTPTPTQTPTPIPTPTPPSPQALLEAAFAAQESESCRFEMDIQMLLTEGDTTTEFSMTFDGDFLPPDQMQGTVSLTLYGMTIESEMIIDGETIYATNPETGEWEVSDEPASPFAPEDFSAVDPNDIEDLAIVGQETLDGIPVYHLMGTMSVEDLGDTFAGMDGELKAEYWIGVEHGRLRESTVEGEMSMPGFADSTIGLAATVSFSEFGQVAAIEPPELPTPIPVATFPAPAPTPAQPVAEAMLLLEPGWTTYMTEAELADNLPPGVVLAGGFWTGFAVDPDGALWFTTLGGGVFRFDGETWTAYSEEDGLASNIVLSITEGRGPLDGTGGMLWFATAEGLCRFDGETWTSYPESAHLAGGPGVTAIAPDGALWYGTAKGATRFDGESWTTYTTADGLASNYVLAIVVGSDGALWFATNGGVSRFDGEGWTSYTTLDGLVHDRVTSAALAPDGALWFGTDGGVSRFDGASWTTYTTADGLASDAVDAVAAAHGTVLWCGTEGGVSRFDGETWTSYTTADGLVNDAVSIVGIAPDGSVWFGTEAGISRYLPPAGTPATPAATPSPSARSDVIAIGINAPLTGDLPKVGEETEFTAEMWLEDIEAAGGLEVGGSTYQVELVLEDNESRAEVAAAANTKLVTQDQVLAIVGPQSSKQAVPAGGMANDLECPMISPWSTHPSTTLDRPWVFRAAFLDPFQGTMVADFLTEEFDFTEAAVLYDLSSDYPRELAEAFRVAWQDIYDGGSVVAFETFTIGATDFATQLTTIKDSGAELLFVPQFYDEVARIVRQARDLGYDGLIVGGDAWGTPSLLELCGDDCQGLFFSTHFVPAGTTGAAKAFVERYVDRYGYAPSDAAALTWDTLHIVQRAIQDCGEITGDLEADRQCVRDALAGLSDFEGITGKLVFDEQGDPIKCVVIARIGDEGEFEFYKWNCPEELE